MKHEIHEVRSGGQTGADIAGLMSAKVCGLKTGGWMPKGWTTQDGPKPQYETLFNMREHYASAYPPRTYANVKDSDATIRFATHFDSSGERCTLKAIKSYGKPYFDVHPDSPQAVEVAAEWIRSNDIRRLNVAGNAKRTSPKIGIFAYNYLIDVYGQLGYSRLEELEPFHTYVVLRLSSPEDQPGSP